MKRRPLLHSPSLQWDYLPEWILVFFLFFSPFFFFSIFFFSSGLNYHGHRDWGTSWGFFFVVVYFVCVFLSEHNFLQLFGQLSFLEGGGSNMSRLLCLKYCPLVKEGENAGPSAMVSWALVELLVLFFIPKYSALPGSNGNGFTFH